MYGTSKKSHSLDILQIICICLFLSRRVRVMSNVWKSFFFNHYVRNVPLAKKVHQNLVILIDWLPHIQVVHCVHWEEWNNSFFLARISDKVITITHQSLNTASTRMPTNINACSEEVRRLVKPFHKSCSSWSSYKKKSTTPIIGRRMNHWLVWCFKKERGEHTKSNTPSSLFDDDWIPF